VQNAESFTSHKKRFWRHVPISCGDTITTDTSLFTDLDCSGHSGGAALTLQEGANLNMNGKKIIGNSDINCIEIRGDGVKIREGTVTQCDYGIRVRSDRNMITSVKISDSDNVGLRIDGNENLLIWCTVTDNHTQGIKINGGSGNKISSTKVRDNCRDGIEIEGDENRIFFNDVENNGNPDTCAGFEEKYKPWSMPGSMYWPAPKITKSNTTVAGAIRAASVPIGL